MARPRKIRVGDRFKVDSYQVGEYGGERFVDEVVVLVVENFGVLCYSPKHRANVLVWRKDLGVRV
jgi:hypothetical protein